MRRLQIKFPNQIRISGWDFGSSARAMNQAGGKDSLMTYECEFPQADLRTVRKSTTERKSMSTKTSIKRIALVAVSALTLGLFSALPSNAVSGVNDGNVRLWCSTAAESSGKAQNISGNDSCTGIAGPANSVTLSYASDDQAEDALTGDNAAQTAAAAVVVVTGSVISAVGTGMTIGAGGANVATSATIASAQAAVSGLVIPTPTVGTITVKYYKQIATGVYSSTASETVTITVIAAGLAGIYSYATTGAMETSTAVAATEITSTTTAAFSAVSAPATNGARAAAFKITQYDANGNALSSGFKSVTASTTLGSIAVNGSAATGNYAVILGTSVATTDRFYLIADGRSGTATVTLTANGVTVGTYSVTFYSSTIASLSAVTYRPNLANTAGDFTKGSSHVWVVAKDASGNPIVGGTLGVTVTSSNSSIATLGSFSYNSTAKAWIAAATAGGVSGTATFTIKDAATGLISTTASVTTASATIAKVVLAMDNTTYKPGELVTVTLTATDKDGKAVADGTYAGLLASAVKSTQQLSNTLWLNDATEDPLGYYSEGDVVFRNGVATKTFYAPGVSFKLMVDMSDSNNIAYAFQEESLEASATIVTAADDATDAANDAVEAANAATDAANAAAEAADAATAAAQDAQAAVADLAAQVATLISGIKAQITRLTNLVIKIQKKVNA